MREFSKPAESRRTRPAWAAALAAVVARRHNRIALGILAVVGLAALGLASLRGGPTELTPMNAAAAASDERPITCRGGRNLHVGPEGTPQQAGTPDAPRDLASALTDTAFASPCDVIWVHEGTYRGTFVTTLQGREGAPIIVRAWPGDRVVIDSAPSHEPALALKGTYTWIWGLEITSSAPGRVSTQPIGWPSDLPRGTGVTAAGTHNKLINVVIHDMARGIEIEPEAIGTEIYGSTIFNNGWEGPEASNGHGIETHNAFGVQRLRDNIIFNQFSHGIIALGTDTALVDHLVLEGNMVFNNGMVGRTGFARDILVGGRRPAKNSVLRDNSTYGGAQTYLGYGTGCEGGVVSANYFVGSTPLVLSQCAPRMSANTLFGQYGFGALPKAHPDNRYLASAPTETVIRVRRNQYAPELAYVAIYNWSRHATVALDLATAGLAAGDKYEVMDVQSLHAKPILSGTFDGRTAAAVPMSPRTTTAPVGLKDGPAHTAPVFGVFVVRRIAPAAEAPPTT